MVLSHINLAAGIPSNKVKYSRLSSTDDGYVDFQFKKSSPKIPYKAIALATVLFFFFFSFPFIFISWRLITLQYCCIGKGSRPAVPVLIVGILVFLPGFYHLHIAYYASKGYWGHSYDEVPDFDD
ncbi:hypothetical protein FD755_021902 [Muntiacus reevesi]|uniref:Transmembrane protein 230 n=1 Tax=Muntiacus reevesi TaxID=9886 RepID=A0A5N3W2B1_MUNRE|nr:hypothetical protein FD755_021902 [Muntiacus reevesi]